MKRQTCGVQTGIPALSRMLQDAIVKPSKGGSITKNGLYNTAFSFLKYLSKKKDIMNMKKSFYLGIIVLAVILFAISYFVSPAVSKPVSNVFVSLTDPANVPSGTTSLNISYNSLYVHVIKVNSSSSWIDLNASGSLDLLTLTNVSQILGSFAAPNGTIINMLKFNISSSSIELNGTVYPVTVPSNQVIINVPPSQSKVNGTVNLLADFSPTVIPILTANSTIFILVPSARAVVIPGFHKVSIGAREGISTSQKSEIESTRPNLTASGVSLSETNGTTSFSITITDNSNESVVLQHILLYGPENVTASISAVNFINKTMQDIEDHVPINISNINSSINRSFPSDLSAGNGSVKNQGTAGETEVEATDRQEAEVQSMRAINFFVSSTGSLVLPFEDTVGLGISATAVSPSCKVIPSNHTIFNNSESDLTSIVRNCFAPLGYTIKPFSSATFTFTGKVSLGFGRVVISPIVGDTYKIVVQGENGARVSLNSTAT